MTPKANDAPVLCNGSPIFGFSFQVADFAYELDYEFWFSSSMILAKCSAVDGFPLFH
jgi:hypothetical protein